MRKILVIGGACQGKTKWVQDNFKEYRQVSFQEILRENRQGKVLSAIYLDSFHSITRGWIKEGGEYKKNLECLRKTLSWVIVANEIGNGVVPMDPFERKWREETGRMLCELAKDADEVYRIYSGIPVQIKGGNKAW